MSRASLQALASTLLLVYSVGVSAQTGPPRHQVAPRVVGAAKWNPSSQEIYTAYWTLEPGWNTELEMRNNLHSYPLIVTPILRKASGAEISLSPVTIAPQHIVSLDLRSAEYAKPEILDRVDSFGSVVFRFSGLDSANLFAATVVRRLGEPINFHFDADDSGPAYHSGGIEGIWWLPTETSTDYLILTNPSSKAVTGRLGLTGLSRTNKPVPITIGPHQTIRVDLRELLSSSATGGIGGLSLSLPGKESLAASQIVFDDATGLTAMMKLFDREPDDTNNTHVLLAPMMALSQPDPSLGFPDGTTLIPRIFLRNAGSGATHVSLNINWRSQTNSGDFATPTFALAPGDVQVVNISDYENANQIPVEANWATITIGFTGRRADLIPIALSYDKTDRYGLQTPFSEALSRLWAGGMWHVDATHNTFITTGNAGTEPTTAEATLFYNGGRGKYVIRKLLQPGEPLWLDVGNLIHNQIPDADGQTIPPDTMNGSYELRDVDHPLVGQLYEGKLVVDKTYGHAAYGCGTCCGYTIPRLLPDPFSGPPGIDNTEVMDTTEQCGGDTVDIAGDAYAWNSTNTAVATLPTMVLHTVAPGVASGRAKVTVQNTHPAPRCPQVTYEPQQPVCVGTLSFNGEAESFIFVGTDPNIISANTYFLQYSPTGGTFSGTSSNSGDSITFTPASGLEKAQVQTSTQSQATSDRTLTFSYTAPNCTKAAAVEQTVTARQFAYLTNGTLSNVCSAGYGYQYFISYTPYTHPDGTVVPPGLDGTKVSETITPQTGGTSCTNYVETGDAGLNANSQFSDQVALCSNAPIPSCDKKYTQQFSIGQSGTVRTNILEYTNTALTYTNQGPTQ